MPDNQKFVVPGTSQLSLMRFICSHVISFVLGSMSGGFRRHTIIRMCVNVRGKYTRVRNVATPSLTDRDGCGGGTFSL